MRLSGTKLSSIGQSGGLGNQLWDLAGSRPSLDLRFADNKSLVDATTGQNLVDFSRASGGTYVDSQGVIRNATTNLLLRSEEFDNASWTKTFGTVTNNATESPDGNATADLSAVNIGSNFCHVRQTHSFTASAVYTLSCYAKASGFNDFRIIFSSAAFGTSVTTVFDLGLGTVVSSGASSAEIKPIGNGWYRCSATATATATSSTFVQLQTTGNGDGTSGTYLWGAQLEQSSTVGEYIPTTSTINSAPRFDHNPTTGESLGLLVEEARTNLLLRSEEFSTTWTPVNINVNTDTIVAPNGTQTADVLVDTTDTAPHTVFQSLTGLLASTQYTASCYMKKGSKDYAFISFGSNASWGTGTGAVAYFDLVTGTVSSTVNTIASIQNVGNGWYRCIATATTVASPSSFTVSLGPSLNGTQQTYLGDNTEAVYIWGAQLEAGAFPTSYIKTEAATATRAADVCSISGSNFSSWYRQDEGTVFVDASSTRGSLVGFSDGTTTERYRLNASTTAGVAFGTSGGTTQFNINTGTDTWISPAKGKGVIALGLNNVGISANGSSVVLDNSATAPVVNRMLIGDSQVATSLNGALRRLAYWPTRLPNSTLQRLTQ